MELNVYLGLLGLLLVVMIIGGTRRICQIIDEYAARAKARHQTAMAKLMDPKRKGWDD